MAVNGKTADQMRDEFYEALRQERAERNESFRQEREERLAASRRFEEEMRQRQIERDAEWKKITGEWGRFNNDEGGMVEYEGVSALRDLSEIGGMRVAAVLPTPPHTKKGREYDGIIFCPAALVLLEFKRRLTADAVRRFLDVQLPAFRADFPALLGDNALYGAVAGATIDDDVRELAEENGIFVIRVPANRRVVVVNDNGRPQA